MTSKYQTIIVSSLIVLLVTILNLGRKTCVEGLQTIDRSNFHPTPEGTIKTIEDLEDDDLIDCVEFYKQSALRNPLFKDKTIQMKPSSRFLLTLNKTNNPPLRMIQNWHKYGECPKGTVPIIRSRNYNDTFQRRYDDPSFHEYARGETRKGKYFGARAFFNVWKPQVEGRKEFSLSQMWLVTGINTSEFNSLEAGWMVYPHLFGDSKTRLFTFWTRDNYQTTHCYNNQCNGFVQTNNKITLGAALEPVSEYDRGDYQQEYYIALSRDKRGDSRRRWWLTVNNEEIGFFRSEIFTTLQSGANVIAFGGEITNLREKNRHTSTQMGSGHFSSQEFSKASFIRNMEIINSSFLLMDADISRRVKVSKPQCYDFTMGEPGTNFRSHIFFGGPGYSEQCP